MNRKVSDRNKRNKINKKTSVVLWIILIIFFTGLFFFYRKPIIGIHNNMNELSSYDAKIRHEERIAAEWKSQIEYLNSPEGKKFIAKLNGFYEPGEQVIILSENTIIPQGLKQQKNIFGKKIKFACKEHTKKGRYHYNSDCVSCRKINELFEKDINKEEYNTEDALGVTKEKENQEKKKN